MDFKIYFCADGILRAQYSEKDPMIPLSFLHSENGSSDLKFWANWWENEVLFEEGLTVGKFLSCLEPWTEFWSDVTSKNIGAYIKESRKPLVVKEDNKEDEIKPSWVGIFFMTNINPTTEYSKEDNSLFDDDIEKWFNTKKNQRLSGTWQVESHYKVSSYVENKDEHYSIDYTPMNELANTPIYLLPEHYVQFSEWETKRILGKIKGKILKNNAFGVNKLIKENHTLEFLEASKYHRMREVVEGFFYWMFTNPSSRDDMVADLIERKDELDEFLENEKNEKEVSNVVPLKPEFAIENEESSEDLKEDKKLTVKIAPNAFSPLIAQYEAEKEYWTRMLEAANKGENVVLKIGTTKEAVSPEKRIYGYVIPKDDENANPKPSKYKKY